MASTEKQSSTWFRAGTVTQNIIRKVSGDVKLPTINQYTIEL